MNKQRKSENVSDNLLFEIRKSSPYIKNKNCTSSKKDEWKKSVKFSEQPEISDEEKVPNINMDEKKKKWKCFW